MNASVVLLPLAFIVFFIVDKNIYACAARYFLFSINGTYFKEIKNMLDHIVSVVLFVTVAFVR